MFELRRFQRAFIRNATRPGIDTACFSTPRGNGKSWLAAHLVARALTPGDGLFVPGSESVLLAASIEQARIVHRFARATLESRGGYRFLDSATRAGITHLATNTRLRVVGSNGRTAMGLVGCPLAIADEPGAWETAGGELLHDAIQTAQGKPGSPLRAVYIGTLAPATDGWWHQMVGEGSHDSVYVQALQGVRETWDTWSTIRKANPLTAISADFRRKLLEERNAARRDSRLKARFLAYRLNLPTADEATVLLTVDDFKAACARPVAGPFGKPIIGVDLGEGRAWSAAVAVWSSGRCEALAVAPGIPSIDEQERRDRVPRGTYHRLVETGRLRTAEGLRVPPAAMVVDAIRETWGAPQVILCDTHRLNELKDHARGTPIVMRRFRYEEASADIRATRKLFLDGPIVPTADSWVLLAASLAVAKVRNHESGNVRLVKRDPSNNSARDDVAAALVLACGALRRLLDRPRRRLRSALAG